MHSSIQPNGKEKEFRPIREEERALVAKLLSADFPSKAALAHQATEVSARRLDSDGSLALRPRAGVPAASVTRRIPVEAELDDIDGVTIHVLLHVVDGLMDELEIYRDDSRPIQRQLPSDELRLLVL